MARTIFTRGQLESELSKSITRLEKEQMGRGPLETRTFIVEDMIVVRMRGILTPAELQLGKQGKNPSTRELIKRFRIELLESERTTLESVVRTLTRRRVRSLHVDVSTAHDEKIIVMTLDRAPEIES